MANVPPEIMNHLRPQLHKDRYPEGMSIPRQRHGIEDEAPLETHEQEKIEPGGIKGILSRLAIRATGPELSGD